jgi:hypothetical protein
MAYVILLLLLLAVVWVVSAPLRRGAGRGAAGRESPPATADAMRRIDLEAARDAKFREIRDAELDHQTGKLSDEDFQAIDSTLRAEAVELLHQLDALPEAAARADDA